MMSGDGLVVRVRPWLGELSTTQALGLAGLAQTYGTGVLELTSRANVQVRGIAEEDHGRVLDVLDALELLDESAAAEHVRNIILTPYRAQSDAFDHEAMAAALMAGLLRPDYAALPSKFGFVIDAQDQRHLQGISGDIRIERGSSGVLVRLDGKAEGWSVANVDEATELALTLVSWFLASGGVGSDGRGRMARHLENGAVPPLPDTPSVTPFETAKRRQEGMAQDGAIVALAFGQLSAAALTALADAAGEEPLRITPHRTVFVPNATTVPAHPDLILEPNDPLLRVTACPGAPGCSQASVPTRGLARRLAGHVPIDRHLHVSGCAKGCAKSVACDYTLVGRGGTFDLVEHGAAWDEATRTGLSPDDALALIED